MTTMVFQEPVLSDRDERELARTIEAGVFARSVLDGVATPPSGVTRTELDLIWQAGEVAYDRFVQANLRLVAMVTRRAASRFGVEADDLFQEGVVGRWRRGGGTTTCAGQGSRPSRCRGSACGSGSAR